MIVRIGKRKVDISKLDADKKKQFEEIQPPVKKKDVTKKGAKK